MTDPIVPPVTPISTAPISEANLDSAPDTTESVGLKNLRTNYENIQNELKKYKDADEKKAKEDAEKRGDYDKIIASKDSEIADKSAKLEKIEAMTKINQALKRASVSEIVSDFVADHVFSTAEKGDYDSVITALIKNKPTLFGNQPIIGRQGLGTKGQSDTTLSHLENADDNASLAELIKANAKT